VTTPRPDPRRPAFGTSEEQEPDDAGCTILHIDMDAFYASVEVRRRPELRGKPVVVGGDGPRGVVSSASYEARRFGIRSAMPGGRARRLCPQAVFLPVDMAHYLEVSRAVMAVFADVTPLVEQLSVDEAFLDVSGARRLFGSPAHIARSVRERIRAELGLPCSVGVAGTKFMAKLASTRAKPDGMLVVRPDRAIEFLHPLPIDALWGVGEQTAKVLRGLGLHTVGDIARAPRDQLRRAVGEAATAHLTELAWARDSRRVQPDRVEKSIGSETTFDEDVDDPEVLRRTLLALSTRVAVRIRSAQSVGRTVAIKVRMSNFTTLTRSRTLFQPTDVAKEIFDTAWSLFRAVAPALAAGTGPPGGDRIRLLGVRLEGLATQDQAQQLTLGEREHGWRDAERAADAAAARFGSSVVRPASLLRPTITDRPDTGRSPSTGERH
jgi:DNA polymerase-4